MFVHLLSYVRIGALGGSGIALSYHQRASYRAWIKQ